MLSFETLEELLQTHGSGWRANATMIPLEGPGSFISPPTYAPGSGVTAPYHLFPKNVNGEEMKCVMLNSTQAEANQLEEVLEQTIRDQELDLFFPQIRLALDHLGVEMSTAELPHRCVDARLRDSELDGVPFRESEVGLAILDSQHHDMTGIYKHDPRSILFGIWDSHAFTEEKTSRWKLKRSLKLKRVIDAHIEGYGVLVRDSRSQLEDPLNFSKGLPYEKIPYYKAEQKKSNKDLGAEIGLTGVPNTTANRGGVSAQEIHYCSFVSLATLRGYRFPVDGERTVERDRAAQMVLATLALLSQALRFERGNFSLRSGCDLIWESSLPTFSFFGRTHKQVVFEGEVTVEHAYGLYKQAYEKAKSLGLGWEEGKVYRLQPGEGLQSLIKANLDRLLEGSSSKEG